MNESMFPVTAGWFAFWMLLSFVVGVGISCLNSSDNDKDDEKDN